MVADAATELDARPASTPYQVMNEIPGASHIALRNRQPFSPHRYALLCDGSGLHSRLREWVALAATRKPRHCVAFRTAQAQEILEAAYGPIHGLKNLGALPTDARFVCDAQEKD